MNLRVLLATGAILLAIWLIVRLIRTVSYPLREKVVLITGGSRGLGLVLARHIAREVGMLLSLHATLRNWRVQRATSLRVVAQ